MANILQWRSLNPHTVQHLLWYIMVYARSDKAKPIAIVVPVEAALQKLAKANGIEKDSVEEMVHDKKLTRLP